MFFSKCDLSHNAALKYAVASVFCHVQEDAMKSLLSIAMLAVPVLLCAPVAAVARESEPELPIVEFFVGYSHLNADFHGLDNDDQGYSTGDKRRNAPGWKSGVSLPITRNLSIDVEGAGNYRNTAFTEEMKLGNNQILTMRTDVLLSSYTVFFGPRLHLGPVFMRAMFGGDCLHYRTAETPNLKSISDSEWSMAGSFGGGVRLPISKLMSFQAGLDYEIARHGILGNPPTAQVTGSNADIHYRLLMQNNLRISAGIVFNIFRKAQK